MRLYGRPLSFVALMALHTVKPWGPRIPLGGVFGPESLGGHGMPWGDLATTPQGGDRISSASFARRSPITRPARPEPPRGRLEWAHFTTKRTSRDAMFQVYSECSLTGGALHRPARTARWALPRPAGLYPWPAGPFFYAPSRHPRPSGSHQRPSVGYRRWRRVHSPARLGPGEGGVY